MLVHRTEKIPIENKRGQLRVLNWLNSTRCILNLKDFQNLEQSYIFTTTWRGTMGQPAYTLSTDGACAK
jgi:hypothetical protein